MTNHYLNTGQRTCHDTQGHETPCAASGQDPELAPGLAWPSPRFAPAGKGLISDRLTGLVWSQDANPAGFPLTWPEALDFVAALAREGWLGRTDWRLPNRRELRSLICHQSKKPALPPAHPFSGVFPGWYWSSTTAAIAPAHAWYVHLEGGRMFYGLKNQSFLLWPVAGESPVLPATGQKECFDAQGRPAPCALSGQDGEFSTGVPWPEPRFRRAGSEEVQDRLTGLTWHRQAGLGGATVRWAEALAAAEALNSGDLPPAERWRMATINELESLVDASAHSPALLAGHPFQLTVDTFWSSTTSLFEPDWAWALYLAKGAVGVGQKKDPHFAVWPVKGL